ncbi:hypothetical protein KPP2020_059 [Klebsiella phage KPP2020]|uniref:Uncharacterized protein n=1 Tax=Klebsiella phage KPP2020 TaxID=3017288 RepID=A0AAE9YK55_9CAUD|nr:hypothetical protein KPP2020_059 [Klebsiella phage KPP2020]
MSYCGAKSWAFPLTRIVRIFALRSAARTRRNLPANLTIMPSLTSLILITLSIFITSVRCRWVNNTGSRHRRFSKKCYLSTSCMSPTER